LGKLTASVISNTFSGFKKSSKTISPLDSKFNGHNGVIYLKNELNDNLEHVDTNCLLDFFLSFDPKDDKLKADEIEVIEPERDHYEIAVKTLQKYAELFNITSEAKLKQIVNFLAQSDKHLLDIYTESKKIISQLISDSNLIDRKDTQEKFIHVFGIFGQHVIDLNTALLLCDGKANTLIENWLKNLFPDDFISTSQLTQFHHENDLNTMLSHDGIAKVFWRLKDNSNKELLILELLENQHVSTEKVYNLFSEIIIEHELSSTCEVKLINSLSTALLLDLWRHDKIKVSLARLKGLVENFIINDFEIAFKKYDQAQLIELMKGLEIDSKNLLELVFENIINTAFTDFDYCIFDIEVNPKDNQIDEFAWLTFDNEYEELEVTEEKITILQDKLLESKLVIGHNIEKFDYQYVFKNQTLPSLTWDTLKVEALLDPTKNTYALKTEHNAFEDCENTKRLFFFQLIRIRSEIRNGRKFDMFSDELIDFVENLPDVRLAPSLITSFNKTAFRSVNSKVTDHIIKSIPKEIRLIVIPKSYWDCFKNWDKCCFKDDESEQNNLVISRDLAADLLVNHDFVLGCINAFIDNCISITETPFLRKLSPYLVYTISEIVSPEKLCHFQDIETEKLIVTPHFFIENQDNLQVQFNYEEIGLIGMNQWKFESQKSLTSFSQDDMEKSIETKGLWVNFSNGKSVAPISIQLASKLTTQKLIQANYWIEKKDFDHFTLISSIPDISDDKLTNVVNFTNTNSTIDNQLILFKSNASNSNRLELNPETLYRDTYWNERLHLITNIFKDNKQVIKNKLILVIQKKSEVGVLQKIFGDLKIYCPNEKAIIQRRFELLQDSHKGIMVCDHSDLESVLLCSSNEPVTFILESLRPNELLIQSGCSVREIIVDAEIEDISPETNDDDSTSKNEDENLPHLGSTIKKISSLNDHYDWLFSRILMHHKDNQFATIDPRISNTSFVNIRVKTLFIKGDPKDEKNNSVSKISKVITSRTSHLLHTPKEFKLGDIDAHLARISAIFLKGKGDENFISSQREYLDLIMPADQDVLVTLPTGTGKSVLFQGPALYRSSYTGKLSIVVTPLKALMEDHVFGLWKQGFWNSVEYINSDKGLEIQDIYRRIAGGELLMVFITPERFRSKGFIRALHQRLEFDKSFEYIVFDEAHCISQWGSEFRPDYFYCTKQVRKIRDTYDSPILLLSATVTKQVAKSIETVLYEKV